MRAISWLWALKLFAGSSVLTPQFKLDILKQLILHADHIERYLSYYFSPNTHLTGEALGLLYLGTMLPEVRTAERWRETGLAILADELSKQVRNDGVYFEQSSYYHRYTTDFYLHLILISRAANFSLPPSVQDTTRKLLDHLMWITLPDGSTPLVGDDDGGRLIELGDRRKDDFRDTLAVGAALFERGDWKWIAGDAPIELLWLLGPEALSRYDDLRAYRPAPLQNEFPDGGYYVIRDGWERESSVVLVDCGPHGSLTCGHAHSDALAFEFAALGKTWLIDSGTFTYTSDPAIRDQFRSTAAHNTVVVDEQSQSVPAGTFSWQRIATGRLLGSTASEDVAFIKGSHDGYERLDDPVTHTRSILFTRPQSDDSAAPRAYLVVRDSFHARGHHSYRVRYHLAPGCLALSHENSVIVAEPGGHQLNITSYSDTAGRVQVRQSFVSKAYGHRDPSLVADFALEASGPTEVTTLIVPSCRGQAIEVNEQLTNRRNQAFRITGAETEDLVIFGNAEIRHNSSRITIRAESTWLRTIRGQLTSACLIQGQQLSSTDGFSFSSSTPLEHCSLRFQNSSIEMKVAKKADIAESTEIVLNGSTFLVTEKTASFASGIRVAKQKLVAEESVCNRKQ